MFFNKRQWLVLTTLFITVMWLNTPVFANDKAKLGEIAPEIELPDANGQILKLSDLKGDLVLLNFWATWCSACNNITNPEFVRLWEEFQNATFDNNPSKGFEIYSVAFDEDRSKWMQKINEQGLNWNHHVIDLASFNSEYWFEYDFRSIPSSFLLDERGKIIAVNPTYEQLKRTLTERKSGTSSGDLIVDNTPPPAPVPSPQPPAPAPSPQPLPPVVNPSPVPTPNPPVVTPTPSPVPAPQPPIAIQPPVSTPSPVPAPQPIVTNVYKIQLVAVSNFNPNLFNKVKNYGSVEAKPISPTSNVKRVLLGRYSTKNEADQILAQVKQQGFPEAFLRLEQDTYINAPIAAPINTPTPPYADANNTVYRIQLGAYRHPDMTAFDNVRMYGEILTESTSNNIERVLLGDFANKSSATDMLPLVKAEGFNTAFIVSRTLPSYLSNNTPQATQNTAQAIEANTQTPNPQNATTDTQVVMLEPNTQSQVMPQQASASTQAGSVATQRKNNTITPTLASNRTMPATYTAKKSLINTSAPDIILNSLVGSTIRLSQLQNDKPTLVYLWVPWTKDLDKDNAVVNELHKKYGDKINIYSVVFSDRVETVSNIIDENKIAWQNILIEPNGVNSDVLKAYHTDELPAAFVINKEGIVVNENLSINANDLDKAVAAQLK